MMSVPFSFDHALHIYRDERGILVPSVTQCLKANGLISFAGINPAVLEHKRQLGTLVHQVTALHDQGEDLSEYDIPEEIWPYVQGYLTFREDCDFTPSIVETRMLGEVHSMRFGMQPDRVGKIRGQLHILELKCGSQKHPAWGIQLAGYGTGLYGPRPTLPRAALQLGPQFARGYKLHPYDEPSDYQIWMASLALTTWLKNHKLFVIENVPERIEAVLDEPGPQPAIAAIDAPREVLEGVYEL
jgi:hypothetical protein